MPCCCCSSRMRATIISARLFWPPAAGPCASFGGMKAARAASSSGLISSSPATPAYVCVCVCKCVRGKCVCVCVFKKPVGVCVRVCGGGSVVLGGLRGFASAGGRRRHEGREGGLVLGADLALARDAWRSGFGRVGRFGVRPPRAPPRRGRLVTKPPLARAEPPAARCPPHVSVAAPRAGVHEGTEGGSTAAPPFTCTLAHLHARL